MTKLNVHFKYPLTRLKIPRNLPQLFKQTPEFPFGLQDTRTQINLHPEITHVKMLVQASIGLISLLQLSGAAFALPAEQERLGTRPPKDAQTVRAE
jgi:hypothetical protein